MAPLGGAVQRSAGVTGWSLAPFAGLLSVTVALVVPSYTLFALLAFAETASERAVMLPVDAAVAALPERQKRVVSRHFGLGCREKPLAEVAAELHVSPQRARAIEQDALFALRQRLYPKLPGA